jgi:hypothetical protein
MRSSGSKLKFYDLHSEGVKVQIMAQAQYVFQSLDPFFSASSSRY